MAPVKIRHPELGAEATVPNEDSARVLAKQGWELVDDGKGAEAAPAPKPKPSASMESRKEGSDS